jgi:hypothetical protein
LKTLGIYIYIGLRLTGSRYGASHDINKSFHFGT